MEKTPYLPGQLTPFHTITSLS